MKLAVSNIAWDNSRLAEHLQLLRGLGCDGVEIAPSCIWPEPIDATSNQRKVIRNLIRDSALEVTGFHALLFTRPDLEFFRSAGNLKETVTYLIQLVHLCSDLGGKILVLGSPRNRTRHGRAHEECMELAADALRLVADACAPAGVTLCIEPLASGETEFIMSADEGMQLVNLVGHPNFQLHLDAKALISSNEDLDRILDKYFPHVRHFHIGDPGIAPPGFTGANHAPLGKALRNHGYAGYVSIEMRSGFGDTREVIAKSIEFVKECYLMAGNLESTGGKAA